MTEPLPVMFTGGSGGGLTVPLPVLFTGGSKGGLIVPFDCVLSTGGGGGGPIVPVVHPELHKNKYLFSQTITDSKS